MAYTFYSILLSPLIVLCFIINFRYGKRFHKTLITFLTLILIFSIIGCEMCFHDKDCMYPVRFNIKNCFLALFGCLDSCNNIDIKLQLSTVGVYTGFIGIVISTLITYLNYRIRR
jgi:hypothetical protein